MRRNGNKSLHRICGNCGCVRVLAVKPKSSARFKRLKSWERRCAFFQPFPLQVLGFFMVKVQGKTHRSLGLVVSALEKFFKKIPLIVVSQILLKQGHGEACSPGKNLLKNLACTATGVLGALEHHHSGSMFATCVRLPEHLHAKFECGSRPVSQVWMFSCTTVRLSSRRSFTLKAPSASSKCYFLLPSEKGFISTLHAMLIWGASFLFAALWGAKMSEKDAFLSFGDRLCWTEGLDS